MDSVEQCSNRCDASFARCRNDDLGAAAIDVVKIGFPRHPHAGQTGKMIDLIDIAEAIVPPGRNRALNLHIFNFRQGGAGRTEIQNPHLTAPFDESCTRCCPMKPLPPVTRTLVMYAGATCLAHGRGELRDCEVLG